VHVERVVWDFVAGLLAGVYRPRPRQLAWQWADAGGIVLDPQESKDFAGPYDSSLTPYVRILHEFYASPDWDELIGLKSSQSGFTVAALVLLGHIARFCPTNVLYALDSREEMRRLSKARLQPMLRQALRGTAELSESEDEISNLTIYLASMVLYLMGSYSSGAFRNKAVGLAILDELDKHKPGPGGEANTIDLARQRLKAGEGGKLIAFSAPILESGVTTQEHKDGSCHVFELPCPHCGQFQELVWENVKFGHCKDLTGEWDLDRVLAETYYECANPECPDRRIEERHKRAMVAAGRWRQTNPKPFPRKMSVRVSDLVSPFKRARWGVLAVEWIKAQGNAGKIQAFLNNRLGRGVSPRETEVKDCEIMALRGPYRRKSIPVAPCYVSLTADRQGDVVKWTKCGWLPDGTVYLIDYGYVLAPDELIAVAGDPFEVLSDGTMVSKTNDGLIDEGYNTTEIRDFCERSDGLFHPSKGRGGIQVRQAVYESTALHRGREMLVYHYDDDDMKKQLYRARIKDAMDEKRQAKRLVRIPRLWLPQDIGPDFIGELTSEKFVEERDPRGFTRWAWVKDESRPNDFGDAMKMHFVLWHIVGEYFRPPSPPSPPAA
jgi:phage terminase large subunit GpA-like protein